MVSMKIRRSHLKLARTKKGAYSIKQIGFAKELTNGSRSPIRSMVGMVLDQEQWDKFLSLKGGSSKPEKKAKKPVNAMSRPDGWAWKPESADIPDLKLVGKVRTKRAKKKLSPKEFYLSKEWRLLRVRVLEKYGCCCMMCGRSKRSHGVVVHVDHIVPRSKRPDLELEFSNLQILCEDCNIGKSNKYQTDWRPDEYEDIEDAFEASKHI